MSNSESFDIIEYLSGLTNFTFDKAVLKRIALDRGVIGIRSYSELTEQQKELLRADLLYEAYLAPAISASVSNSHGAFKQSVGSQQLNLADRERIYNSFSRIYRKYNDEKITEVEENTICMQWLD
jgi:hypothetical protein